MSARFSVFGVKNGHLASIAQLVGRSLDISLSKRESSYKGGEYYFNRSGDGVEISIERNVRDEEGGDAELDLSDYGVLVYVNYGSMEMEDRISGVAGLELLRVEDV